jgi:hypothetical protein
MTIDEFLKQSGRTAEWLAEASGISAVSLSRIRRDEQNCSRDVMRRIITASDGLITAEGLIHAPVATPADPALSAGKGGAFSAPPGKLADDPPFAGAGGTQL